MEPSNKWRVRDYYFDLNYGLHELNVSVSYPEVGTYEGVSDTGDVAATALKAGLHWDPMQNKWIDAIEAGPFTVAPAVKQDWDSVRKPFVWKRCSGMTTERAMGLNIASEQFVEESGRFRATRARSPDFSVATEQLRRTPKK